MCPTVWDPWQPGWLCSHCWGSDGQAGFSHNLNKGGSEAGVGADSHEPEGAYIPEKHLLARHTHLDHG